MFAELELDMDLGGCSLNDFASDIGCDSAAISRVRNENRCRPPNPAAGLLRPFS
jgi:hypothetical protein